MSVNIDMDQVHMRKHLLGEKFCRIGLQPCKGRVSASMGVDVLPWITNHFLFVRVHFSIFWIPEDYVVFHSQVSYKLGPFDYWLHIGFINVGPNIWINFINVAVILWDVLLLLFLQKLKKKSMFSAEDMSFQIMVLITGIIFTCSIHYIWVFQYCSFTFNHVMYTAVTIVNRLILYNLNQTFVFPTSIKEVIPHRFKQSESRQILRVIMFKFYYENWYLFV